MINVIIPAHNRIKYTVECIKSLKKQDCANHLKIFLVDDGSTDNTKKIIKNKFPDVKIFEGDGSLFWGGAVNYGIKKVLRLSKKNDWILLVNNDVEFKSNAISNLVKDSQKYKRKAIMGALTVSFKDKKTVIKSGTVVKSWFFNITSHQFLGLNLKSLKDKIPIKVDFLTGRCLLHPVEIFKKVKNYDSKRFPHYGADDEFSMRVKKFGYLSILCPTSIVFLKENNQRDIKSLNLKSFLSSIFSIKSSSNIINKFRLSFSVVPFYAKLSFFLIGVLKSMYVFLKR
jgi:GT2 family glycosyltransferase|tara:strand:- start:50 stop:904 length:855 start_codon:yes stop_codon:yes gene_type:complete